MTPRCDASETSPPMVLYDDVSLVIRPVRRGEARRDGSGHAASTAVVSCVDIADLLRLDLTSLSTRFATAGHVQVHPVTEPVPGRTGPAAPMTGETGIRPDQTRSCIALS